MQFNAIRIHHIRMCIRKRIYQFIHICTLHIINFTKLERIPDENDGFRLTSSANMEM